MRLEHHGALPGVTGSCHHLHLDEKKSYLIDCGMFQGADAALRESMDIEFPIDTVQALLVTHVHIDHIGRIPYLFEAGYRGPIFCSKPTARLMPIMLEDAMKLGITRNKAKIKDFLNDLKSRLRPLAYNTWVPIPGGASIRMIPAGHVLGSVVIEVEYQGERYVFSGDLGSRHTPILNDPISPERADALVLESTYGDRTKRLEQILCRTMENRGVTLIPAFSLGRTQELLFELNRIYEGVNYEPTCTNLKNIDVIVDSPLALKLTDIYNEMHEFWSDEAQRVLTIDSQPLIFDNLVEIDESGEHRGTVDYLKRTRRPAIVIAGSGMCNGGRIMDYLKEFLDKETTDVVFVGYQAVGTLGRIIQDSSEVEGGTVKIDHQSIPVRAKVHTLSGYSAHADQSDLLKFVQGIPEKPGLIRLVHGEDHAKAVLASKLTELGHHVG
jgi:metallo-beta-lactamase family protein